MATDDILDRIILAPCKSDGDDKHTTFTIGSLTGAFRVDNKPMRIDTLLYIGEQLKLKSYLKTHEHVLMDASLDEEFTKVSGLTFACERSNGSSFVVIWMPRFEWTSLDFETLVHECVHATIMVMKMSGVRAKIFTAENDLEVDDEGLSYGMSTMFTSLLKKMIKKNGICSFEVRETTSAASKKDSKKNPKKSKKPTKKISV